MNQNKTEKAIQNKNALLRDAPGSGKNGDGTKHKKAAGPKAVGVGCFSCEAV